MQILNPAKRVRAFSPFSAAPFNEKLTRGVPWVDFSSDNLYPQRLLHAIDGCGPLYRCHEVHAKHVAGQGLEIVDKNDKPHEKAMDLWYTWLQHTTEEDFLFATARDAVALNARTWHVRRDSNKRIARLDHVDCSRIRAEKRTDGHTPAYWFSADWKNWRKDVNRPERTPVYSNEKKEERQALYSYQYKAGKDSYSEPIYLGCLAAMETWMRVDHFNRTQLDTSFNSSVILFVRNSADKEKMAVMDEELEDVYCGALARGMMVVQLEPGEEAPIVQVVPKSNAAGSQDDTRDRAAGVMYDTYGMPRILVTEQSSGLTSQGLAIQESVAKFYADLVRPIQFNHIIKDLWRLFEDEGFTDIGDIRIKTIKVFESKDDAELIRMEHLRRTTVGESRLNNKLPILTIDGKDPKDDKSNWDPRMNLMLIEIGPSAAKAPEQEQEGKEKEQDDVEKPGEPEEKDKDE